MHYGISGQIEGKGECDQCIMGSLGKNGRIGECD